MRQHVGNCGKGFLLVAAAAVALAASGCTTGVKQYVANHFQVGPNYGRPAAPIAPDWIDANDQRLRTEPADISRWWTSFNDPMLDQLIVDTYRQNLTLREAGFRILQARAVRNIQAGNLFPQFQEAYGSYSRIAQSKRQANTRFLPQQFYDQWDAGFNLSWELDFWGRFRRAIEAADADLDASVEAYDDVLVTLIGDAAAVYVELRTNQRQLALTRTNIQLQRESLVIAQARFQGGQTSELDVDQAQSNLSQTESLVPQLEIRLRNNVLRLCVLLGIPPENLLVLLGERPIPLAPAEIAVGIPAQLLARRPDVRRAERLCAAQCARIGVAESELYPHISIGGTLGYSAEHLDELFTSKAFLGNITPQFHWNILNYGRLQNNILLQDARFQELIAAYQNQVVVAQAEVEQGLILYLKSRQRAAFLVESVAAAERAVTVALAQYQGGLVDFNRVALLQQNLVTQQDQLAQAQGNISLGMIEVYRALGGGWEIRCYPLERAFGAGMIIEGPPLPPGAMPETLPPPMPTDDATMPSTPPAP